MTALNLYNLGKKSQPGTIVLVKTEAGYISFGGDLKKIKAITGKEVIPESELESVSMEMYRNGGHIVSTATLHRELE